MRKQYHLGFTFKDTEEEAQEFCAQENKTGSYYKRKTYLANYTPWTASDGSYNGFVCWYHC